MATKKSNTIKLKFDSSRNLAPAPESKSAAKINPRYDLFINGKFEKPSGKKYFDTINPATEEKLSEVAEANEADVNKAVKAARDAYDKVWNKMPAKERAKYIYRIARMVQERAREFSVIETLDGGKPIRESRDFDVPTAANHFFYYAGWADKLEYAFPNRNVEPLGVAGQIIPWNFPLLMAAWKIAPALATGNTVVLKPAKTTPLTALKLAEVIQEADLPPGVVNIVTGNGSTMGMALVNHPDVSKIAFTGSTEVAKLINQALAKRDDSPVLIAETGGQNALIADSSALPEQIVRDVVAGRGVKCGRVGGLTGLHPRHAQPGRLVQELPCGQRGLARVPDVQVPADGCVDVEAPKGDRATGEHGHDALGRRPTRQRHPVDRFQGKPRVVRHRHEILILSAWRTHPRSVSRKAGPSARLSV